MHCFKQKKFPNIVLNGGGDLTHPTINNKQIKFSDVPLVHTPIWQYDSSFRTKEVISQDRARFARAWFDYFNEWGDRGGGSPEEAFDAWFRMIEIRYKKHVNVYTLKIHHRRTFLKQKREREKRVLDKKHYCEQGKRKFKTLS